MVLTRAQVEDTARRCYHFMVDAIQWDYSPDPNELLPPVRRPRAHPTSHGETAPLVCAVKKDSSAMYSVGELRYDRHGAFHPLNIKGTWDFLFPSRKSECEISEFEDQSGDSGTFKWLKKSYRYEFKKGATTKAIYDVIWEARHSYRDGTPSNVLVSATKVFLDSDAIVIWIPNRIIDDVPAPHWHSSRGADRAAFVSPGFEAQGHLLRWKSGLLRSGVHRFGNEVVWSPVEPVGRALDAAIATDKAYDMYFYPHGNFVSFWSSFIGHQDRGMVEFPDPKPDPGHYIHHHQIINGDLALANDPIDSITFKKYMSRTFTENAKKIYLRSIWPQSPYNHSLEAVDRCLRYGPDGLDGEDGALAWLDRCKLEPGAGMEILRWFPPFAPVIGIHGQGEAREHLELKDHRVRAGLPLLPYKRGHEHYISAPSPIVPTLGIAGYHDAYSSNWLAAFCHATTICYQYAKFADHPRARDLADYARESAAILVQLQFTGETFRAEDEQSHGSIIDLPNVCSYGSFPFGYNFGDDGNPYGLRVVSDLQAAVHGVLREFTTYDQQDPFPMVKGFGETVWLVLGAFLNMLATDLV